MQGSSDKFCTFVQSEIISNETSKLNSLSVCVEYLAAEGNLAELIQFSSH